MVQTEIDRRLGALEKHEQESEAWYDRIIALEHKFDGVADWIEEQKEMQKDRAAWHRNQMLAIIGFGVTILASLLVIYFK